MRYQVIVKVRCTYEIEVELKDDDDDPYFHIEENSCPATGVVGGTLDKLIEHHDNNGTCWACACSGKNEILEIRR